MPINKGYNNESVSQEREETLENGQDFFSLETEKFLDTPPQNPKLELLKKHFPEYFTKGGFDLNKFQAFLNENEQSAHKESYSLNYLGKKYAQHLCHEAPRFLLKEDIAHNSESQNHNSENLLLKGDNFEVLKLLKNAYQNKIKMIYIDPPYNTGSDGFVYQDDRSFTPEQLASLIPNMDTEEAERILAFTHKKANSHSAWLTFMHPRLYLARELLTEDGVIFISIDDNEVAQLRLLCDEIFGEENFLSQVIWERAYAPVNLMKHFSPSHDYLLCYAKNMETTVCNGIARSDETDSRYQNPDNDPRGVWSSSDISVGPAIAENVYPITTPSGRIVEPPAGRSWRLSKNAFLERLADNRIWFGADGNNVPRIKRFKSELRKQGVTPMTLWKHTEVGHSQDATKALSELFDNQKYFDYPKPVNLIKRCIQLYSNPNDLILDFFAGSGTTADAVMQLNAEDGGKRKFILVQLPELIDEKKSKTAFEFVKKDLGVETPTIFEITKERIKRSATAIEKTLQDSQQEKPDLGFKIFELTENFLEKMRLKMLQNADLVNQENAFTEENLHTLLTSWRLMDGSLLTDEVKPIDLAGVAGFLCSGHFYVLSKDFGKAQITAFLDRLEQDPNFQPTRFIFLGEQMASDVQRTLKEALQQLSNKKSLHISFMGRY